MHQHPKKRFKLIRKKTYTLPSKVQANNPYEKKPFVMKKFFMKICLLKMTHILEHESQAMTQIARFHLCESYKLKQFIIL